MESQSSVPARKNYHIFALFVPLFLMEAIYVYVVQNRNEFNLAELAVWFTFSRKLIFDWIFYLAVIYLLLKTLKSIYPPLVFAAFYLFLIGMDTAMFYFGSTLFENDYLELVEWYSVREFLISPQILLLLAILLVLIYITRFALAGIRGRATWKKVLITLAILIIMAFPDMAGLINGRNGRAKEGETLFLTDYRKETRLKSDRGTKKRQGKKLGSYLKQVQKEELRYISQNSLINFTEEIMFDEKNKKFKVSDGTGEYKRTVKKYDLPLGERFYDSLHLKEFNKIILFASESLPLDGFSGYNSSLEIENSLFYSSDIVRKNMFTNYMTTTKPTLKAIMTLFYSHPNFDLLVTGNFKNSLVKILGDRGYETIFLRSASKYFANENVHFKNIGFQKIIAKEYFEKKPENKKYIRGWGVMDRLVYDELIKILREKRDEKVFITVLGVDTHAPSGRGDYGDLKYPAPPDDFSSFGSAGKLFESLYYHDYDMSVFMKKLVDEGLFAEDTLVVLTSDHCPPSNKLLKDIPGYPKGALTRIPLAFITPQYLPAAKLDVLASQMDLAPTLLHLLNLEIPDGWWGESLFSDDKEDLNIGVLREILYIDNGKKKRRFSLERDDHKEGDNILSLFNTMILN